MSTAFERLDRTTLAMLAREYLLAGHLIDRSGMAHVLGAYGLDAMRDIAIDEWMGASPVYTRRVRRALRFEGDDVVTIFKGMQVDIGAPPRFMDFRYSVTDAGTGEFWLDHCGALMDVEPLGTEFVVNMCHHIEDPTFDATAAATNPKARMRPVHRPPREPAGRTPHCRWSVTIDDDAEPLGEPEAAERIARTRAAGTAIGRPPGEDSGGATDYAGPLQPDLSFERFSKNTLVELLGEICLQGHLLTLSFADAIERRYGEAAAAEIATKQFTGIAGVAAGRLHRALGGGDGIDAIASVLELHPAFHPRSYIDVETGRGDPVTVSLRGCPAIGDRPGRSWADVLAGGSSAPLDAIVGAVERRARCVEVEPAPGALRTWSVKVGRESLPVSREVKVTRYSTGADFAFDRRPGDRQPGDRGPARGGGGR